MTNTFKISYSWKQQNDPWLHEEEFIDVSPLFLSLQRFLSLYEGTFQVQVDDLSILFDLDPDLSTIFNEIPVVLEHLATETQSQIELDFFEQGTDLCWKLERDGDKISVRFIKGSEAGVPYRNLPDETFWLDAHVFITEWSNFIQSLLIVLTELQPNLIKEESYQEYICLLKNLNIIT